MSRSIVKSSNRSIEQVDYIDAEVVGETNIEPYRPVNLSLPTGARIPKYYEPEELYQTPTFTPKTKRQEKAENFLYIFAGIVLLMLILIFAVSVSGIVTKIIPPVSPNIIIYGVGTAVP